MCKTGALRRLFLLPVDRDQYRVKSTAG